MPAESAARAAPWAASMLIAANLNPKVIQTRLGHATITETMDTYGISSLTPKTSDEEPSTPPSPLLRRNRDGTNRHGDYSAAGQRDVKG